jgi:hypothetical protein
VRNLIVLLTLIVLLGALRGLAQIISNWHYVVPVAPGELAYVATFDALVDDWEQYGGQLSVESIGSALRIEVDTPRSLPFSTARPYFADFDLRVEARPLAGPLDNGYGVVFRVQDPQNYYLFLVSSDGYYQVRRAVQAEDHVISDWIPSPLVRQGMNVSNWLRVVAQGDQLRFYINNEPVELCIPDTPGAVSTFADRCIDGQMQPMLTDDALPVGQIGVIAQALLEPGVVVEFDNVLVYGPGAA